jgi:hypothetical protein
MGVFKPDSPTPPNPIETARASTSTNVSTAVANAFLNNVNQNTPQGSLNYDPTGNYNWTDPTTGTAYNIPTFTATQSLSPSGQAIQTENEKSQYNLANMAANQSASLRDLLGSPVNLWGVPEAPNTNWLEGPSGVYQAQLGYGDVGGQQRSLGPYAQQQTTFGDEQDYNKAREHVEQALFQRMDPQLQRDRAALEARLADQGIQVGSMAHQQAMDQFNRQLTDTRLGITQAGAAEQQQAYAQALGRGQFANQAQMEQFQKQLQSGTFANQAQQQAYQQEALRAQFSNAALAQRAAQQKMVFDARNQLRAQSLAEQYQQRNQPINEITALLSGSQVQGPQLVNTPSNQIATTDIAGLINNRFSQDMDSYKQQSANFNSLMGGIFGALGGLAKSDRREKEDIDKIGSIFAAGPMARSHCRFTNTASRTIRRAPSMSGQWRRTWSASIRLR